MTFSEIHPEPPMQLDWQVLDLQTRHAFHIARQPAPSGRRSVWIRLCDAEGNEGWGEAAATPYYGETADSVSALLPRLRTALTEAAQGDPLELERIETALQLTIGRNPSAKAGISAALHDLIGKRLGLPVWKLWGLNTATAPASSFTIGIDEIEVMRSKVRDAVGRGILKIKVGTGRDEEILQMIRDEAPDVVLRVDANTGWTAKQALQALPMLREFGVELIEQPLRKDDIEGLRLLRRRSPLPIIADESCQTTADVARLVGAVDGINVKLEKCGSLREGMRMIHCARAHGMSVMVGCMVSSTLAIAAAAQLAPLADYADLDGAALLRDDPFVGPGLAADGSIRLNTEPGLGVRQREAR